MNRLRIAPDTWRTLIAVTMLLMATVAVYFPGMRGPFMFDDYINIVDNAGVAMQALTADELIRGANSGISSEFGRPVSYLSFALNHYLAGGFDDGFSFKLVNVIIHGFNALLVLWLTRLLFEHRARREGREMGRYEQWLPFLTTAIWALHPIQLTSVLYVVQRMTSLSALFVLLGLIAYVIGRQRFPSRPRWGIFLMTTGIVGGTALGFLAKENAVLLLPLVMVIETTLFSQKSDSINNFFPRRMVYAGTGIFFFILGLWLFSQMDWISAGYRLRHFTITERLLTEARAIWFYLGLLFFPGTTRLTLFHDDFPISAGLAQPWSTLPAVLGLAGLLVLGVALRRRQPAVAFAILWFLVGHSLESSFLALELVHEHRNYLPSLGPLIAATYAFSTITRGRNRMILGAGMAVAATLAFTTFVLAVNWRDQTSLASFMLRHHPASARSHEAMAAIYLHKHRNPMKAMEHYAKAAELSPHETSYGLKLVLTATEAQLAESSADNSVHTRLPAKSLFQRPVSQAHQNDRMKFMLDPEVHDHISRQLATQPLMGGVPIAFGELVNGIIEEPQHYGFLRKDAVDWLKTAVDNPRSPTKVKLQLMQMLVRLYIENGQLAEAELLSRRSLEIGPANPALTLMYSNVLYLAGRLDEAESNLQLFKNPVQSGHENEWREAEYLKTLIAKSRSR